MKKTIAVLGATGSVGKQALDVAEKRGFRVDMMSADKSVGCAERLARQFEPRFFAMASEEAARDLKARLADTSVRVLFGKEGILEGIAASESEVAVNAIIGSAGLEPSLAIIDAGRRLALANKESLVIAGELVMKRAAERGVEILPVDSEHSAIFQSLLAGRRSEIKRLILTASGGPFFGKTKKELEGVTLSDALAHPTWKMGKKITVDSATLMNKGFEVIEAAHLFGVPAENISVVVHRESILHSAVEYIDNTVIAELSVPDMRSCIQYAIDYPERRAAAIPELDLFSVARLGFARPDTEAFPLLSLAARAHRKGGVMPAVLNAADEVAVAAFLAGKLSFLGISELVAATFDAFPEPRGGVTLEGLLAADREARSIADSLIEEF